MAGHGAPQQPTGFGLPEVFTELGRMLGRDVPGSESEARTVLAFYRKYGPLPREAFEVACKRSIESLGSGRPLTTYLADLERQIQADGGEPTKNQEHP